jgi:hypothetical protein
VLIGNINPGSGFTIVTDELVVDADVPFEFVAVIVNVYDVPCVNPVNVYGDEDVV